MSDRHPPAARPTGSASVPSGRTEDALLGLAGQGHPPGHSGRGGDEAAQVDELPPVLWREAGIKFIRSLRGTEEHPISDYCIN